MNLPTQKDLLNELRKKENSLSTILNFEELIQNGILTKKKGTKAIYQLLKPNELPKEAWDQISEEIFIDEKKGMFLKFITEKQRNKRLVEIRKILK